MKKKPITYVLLVAVAVVWGTLGYRLVVGLSDGDDEFYTPAFVPQLKANEAKIDSDTLKLIAKYRDPFLGKQYRSTYVPKSGDGGGNYPVNAGGRGTTYSSTRPKVDRKLPVPQSLAQIVYYGTVDRELAIMDITDQNFLVEEGEEFGEYKLIKVFEDSIHLLQNNKRVTIKRN